MNLLVGIILLILLVAYFSIAASISTIKKINKSKNKLMWILFTICLPILSIVIFVSLYRNTSGGTWTEFEGPIYGVVLFFLYLIINCFVQKAKAKSISAK